MRISAETKAWRKVEGMMGDIHISCKRKGNEFNSCISRAYLNDASDDGTDRETTGDGSRFTNTIVFK